MTHPTEVAWSIAVFSSREKIPQLLKVIAACQTACRTRSTTIDVIVNGNAGLAAEFRQAIAKQADASASATVRVWHIALGDKAHAWNTYIREIWPGGTITFFIDGYVEVREDAFLKLEAALTTHPHAKAATGVDVMGRSAEKLAKFQIAISGIHGNLYSLRQEAVLQVRDSGFQLPLGLYRTDPTLESCLKFNFDPATNAWDENRILVVTDVNWKRPVLSLWRYSDWFVHWRRMVRQAQGDVEQEALKTFWAVDNKRPSELPKTAEELIRDWIGRFPGSWRRLVLANPLRLLAVKKACKPRDWTQAQIPPALM